MRLLPIVLLASLWSLSAVAQTVPADVIDMPDTTSSTVGVVNFGGHRLLHNYVAPTITGDGNVFLGEDAGNFTMGPGGQPGVLGGRNVGVGYRVLQSNTTGWQNTGVGYISLQKTTTGIYNTAIGAYTLVENTTGSNNTALGADALWLNIDGTNNVAIGTYALQQNTSGFNNTVVGKDAMRNNLTGRDIVAVGTGALQENTTGSAYATAVGSKALRANTTGNYNTAIGAEALASNKEGGSNTAIGTMALQQSKGSGNTAIGTFSGADLGLSGYDNTFIGSNSGRNITTGFNNTFIGANVSPPGNVSNRIDIAGLIRGSAVTKVVEFPTAVNFTEQVSAPSTPANDNMVMWLEDNGSGKSRLMVRFATGAAVQLAIQP